MLFSPMKTKLRIAKQMSSSSVNTFVTSSDSPLSSSLGSSPTMSPTPTPDRGVGLSDPDQSAGRRRMLELVNRMHNTG